MNIFAHVLAEILKEHGKKSLNSLGSIRSNEVDIHPQIASRLQQSRFSKKPKSCLLNSQQLEMLQEQINLTDEEVRHLRAALLAEGIRRLLIDRVSPETALTLGNMMLQMLRTPDSAEIKKIRDRLVENTRRVQETLQGIAEKEGASLSTEDEQVTALLEPAAEAYSQGVFWLELAHETSDWLARRGYVAHAKALLEAARDLVVHAPSQISNTPEQASWLVIIEAALEEVNLLG